MLSMSDRRRLQERVEAANLARDVVLPLIDGQLPEEHQRAAFVMAVTEELLPQTPPSSKHDQLEPLPRLAAFVMPFGVHHGKTLEEIPFEYLDWLVGVQEETLRSIRAYLQHPELCREDRGE